MNLIVIVKALKTPSRNMLNPSLNATIKTPNEYSSQIPNSCPNQNLKSKPWSNAPLPPQKNQNKKWGSNQIQSKS